MSHSPHDRRRLLTVDVEPVDTTADAAIVRLAGEVDLAGLPLLRRILQELSEQGRIHQVVDMSSVSFIDSAGLGALVGAHQRLRGLGGALHLASVAPTVRTVVTVTGLNFVFRVHEDLAEALAAVGEGSGAAQAGEAASGDPSTGPEQETTA
ncbi:STAS domain-containing protein [Nocardioides sp. R-C-SC26]|uniref:STAS domain-containing protein n=1 Tax=Nocardioides sp. R-C-SC26 TaxID=2870414 RepID=UPI001E4BD63D|nr:STAS domain-containing protein [Nocardioides sp. R-C-SC26]